MQTQQGPLGIISKRSNLRFRLRKFFIQKIQKNQKSNLRKGRIREIEKLKNERIEAITLGKVQILSNCSMKTLQIS